MLTRIDHVMICVPDLARGMDDYARLGFSIHPGGVHPGKGTHNAIAFLQADYVELLAIHDRAEYLAGSPWPGLLEYIGAGGGLRFIILQSDDLAAEVAAMRARGVDIADTTEGGRRTPAGRELRWRAAVLGRRDALPLFFIQHLTPLEERRRQVPDYPHPNQVTRLERACIAVPDLAAALPTYRRVLGIAPTMERASALNADVAVFPLGANALVLAQPTGPGMVADTLKHHGPGAFRVLCRTASIDAAARRIAAAGLPPPARAMHQAGEQTIEVPPERAGGVHLGFVGPA